MDKKIKLLIIEDDPFLLSMYSTKFELEGFDIIAAEDGEKGLLAAAEEFPDMILLDILLPKMDGFDVLRELKKQDALRNIPVILLTNLSQKQDIEQGLALGAEDYLVKAHFMPSEVVEKIRKILNK